MSEKDPYSAGYADACLHKEEVIKSLIEDTVQLNKRIAELEAKSESLSKLCSEQHEKLELSANIITFKDLALDRAWRRTLEIEQALAKSQELKGGV